MNLPYAYDYAAAYMEYFFLEMILNLIYFYSIYFSLDIWSGNPSQKPDLRSASTGYTGVASVCMSNRFAILEFLGFSGINDAAHSLGYS
jgi:hypothetical protein